MPELRGIQATEEVKAEWQRAWKYFEAAPVTPAGSYVGRNEAKKYENTQRIAYVARMMNLTRKQAKRRVKNYRQWQANIQKGTVHA